MKDHVEYFLLFPVFLRIHEHFKNVSVLRRKYYIKTKRAPKYLEILKDAKIEDYKGIVSRDQMKTVSSKNLSQNLLKTIYDIK